ncbi:L,D-transpeptidase [Myxacorys almedinensis]|uniref:L,D-transpeptidase family protein n=1 Tax=Myxacorys almedinensis A TaxID=2690445 RepID=A0A8J8CIP1_9CYAN|nr:L,D-transpeptidase [Myxacorys almedinensis]NDJ17839.1 L,D-transpeptidase family protein [Myxacorys almedinensis A]
MHQRSLLFLSIFLVGLAPWVALAQPLPAPLSESLLEPLSEPSSESLSEPLLKTSPPASPPSKVNDQTQAVRVVVKLKKRRVYVYEGDTEIASYPVAVGKAGWETPTGEHQVINKQVNPTFISFKTGKKIPPGYDNPLGVRWIGIWTDGDTQIGFHGTNQPELLGQAVSHGCLRMWNKDVTALFERVAIGTPVSVQP